VYGKCGLSSTGNTPPGQATATEADCIVILADHKGVDHALVIEGAKLVVDTRNALRAIRSEKTIRLQATQRSR